MIQKGHLSFEEALFYFILISRSVSLDIVVYVYGERTAREKGEYFVDNIVVKWDIFC